MTCKTCGLPVFHGASGYAGPMCQCQWRGVVSPLPIWPDDDLAAVQQHNELTNLQAETAALKEENASPPDLAAKVAELEAEVMRLREALRSVAEKSLAELSALKAENEWQPIETAPRGARGYAWMHLAWGPDEDKNTGCGLHANGKFYAAASFFTMSGERAFEWREVEVFPTHWMPLPNPPAKEGEQG